MYSAAEVFTDKQTKLIYKLFQNRNIVSFMTVEIPDRAISIDVTEYQNFVSNNKIPVYIL